MKVGDLVKIKLEGRNFGMLAVVISDGEKIWDGTPIHDLRPIEPLPNVPLGSYRYLEQNLELISESR